jgi:Flp pilus assembly protein TadD
LLRPLFFSYAAGVKAEAWHARAAIALRDGDAELAVQNARRAVALDRNNPLYLNRLGIAHGELGDLRAAEQAFRRALKASPAYAAGHHNLAKALQKQGRLAEALQEFERAHKLEPQAVEMQLSLCGIYRLNGEPERALAVLRAAAGDGPAAPALVPQFADCIADVEGPPAAVGWLRNVVAQQPDSQPAHYALAVMLLSVGEWREGWEHFLWRPRSGERPASLPKPLVLRGEYGLGDVLFFLRFASGPFALQLPPPLAKLASILAGIELVESAGAAIGIADLPSLLGTQAVPPPFPLKAERDARLARLGPAPYLGLTWRAGTDLTRGPELNVDLRVLLKEVPPAALGAAVGGWPGTLVSLQRAPAPGELDVLSAAARAPVHDLSTVNEDLREALAVLAVLDEYVAVSNTNVHLRAGLGRTARVLVPNPPEWRWMRAGGASPWFPGFGVYRQPASRDWTEPLRQLAADLARSAGSPPRERA